MPRKSARTAAGRSEASAARAPLRLGGGEVAYPLELEAEEQDEGAGGADADGHGAVGEAAQEELPSLVVVEEVCGLLARDRRDGEAPAEAAGGGQLRK